MEVRIDKYHIDKLGGLDCEVCLGEDVDKLISDHKAVVETLRQELKQNQIEYGEMQKNLHFTENDNKILQNKIDELERQIVDTEGALTGAIDCINKMKCCGNCGNPNRSKRYCLNCTRLYGFKESGQKDLWIAKGD